MSYVKDKVIQLIETGDIVWWYVELDMGIFPTNFSKNIEIDIYKEFPCSINDSLYSSIRGMIPVLGSIYDLRYV